MILEACWGRGNGEKDAGKAESRVGSGKGGGWEGGQEGRGWGGVDGNGRGRQGGVEGCNGEEEMGRGATGIGRGWHWGGGQRRGGQWGGEDGKGGKGKEVGVGKRRRRGKRTGDFTDGYDGMPGWTWAIGLQADRMPGTTEAIMFTDSYKHMECLAHGMPGWTEVTEFSD